MQNMSTCMDLVLGSIIFDTLFLRRNIAATWMRTPRNEENLRATHATCRVGVVLSVGVDVVAVFVRVSFIVVVISVVIAVVGSIDVVNRVLECGLPSRRRYFLAQLIF